MITLRKANDRGHFANDWLNSRHSFSFGTYFDPRFTGFRSLRVINEDRVAPGAGFPTHGHRDMEIITYVLSGALEHRDSLGHHGTIRPGEIQRMSAGRGIQHSEFNASRTEEVHFLQIWVMPAHANLAPSYEQVAIPPAGAGRLQVIGVRRPSADADQVVDGVIAIDQDVTLLVGRPFDGDQITYALDPGRYAYVHLARGDAQIGDQVLHAGDGLALAGESVLAIKGIKGAEALIFDMA